MAVPEQVLTNDDLSGIVETNDEWIFARTGIHERRIASERETTAMLAFRAAQQAIDVADIVPEEVDMIIVATSTPDHIFPSTASIVQAQLGAHKASAFDMSAACSGFVYALQIASQMITSGSVETIVVIGAETMSRVLDWKDRATCILFGDGAGAVVLRASEEEGGILSAVLGSDGTGGDLLGIPSVGTIDYTGTDVTIPSPNGHKVNKMHMKGGEVFKFATRVIHESVSEALEMANIPIEDVKLIVPHQANTRIISAAARALKVSEDLFMLNLERYGNTSAASIPIALVEAIQQNRIQHGDPIVFVGFGGGLSWAAMVIRWGVPSTIERGILNRPRREISYKLARLRAGFNRITRQIDDTVRRTRPQRGRMDRLRRKFDREDLK